MIMSEEGLSALKYHRFQVWTEADKEAIEAKKKEQFAPPHNEVKNKVRRTERPMTTPGKNISSADPVPKATPVVGKSLGNTTSKSTSSKTASTSAELKKLKDELEEMKVLKKQMNKQVADAMKSIETERQRANKLEDELNSKMDGEQQRGRYYLSNNYLLDFIFLPNSLLDVFAEKAMMRELNDLKKSLAKLEKEKSKVQEQAETAREQVTREKEKSKQLGNQVTSIMEADSEQLQGKQAKS